MTEITSRKNKIILGVASLKDKRERDSEGLFFTEGKKLINEALSVDRQPVRSFVTKSFLDKNSELVNSLKGELFLVSDEVYDKMSDESAPEGILSVFEKKVTIDKKADSCIVLLEGIQDPGNVGTIIRCAVAFGVSEVLTVGCADIYSPKTVRSTMGAIFKMPCTAFSDIDGAVEYARTKTGSVVATALHSDSVTLDRVDTSRATIMLGSEGRGLSDRAIELADSKVIIPIENIESLNASIAGAICMYDSMLKRKA